MAYFLALAADYDGTLAQGGVVDEATIDALRRLKRSGRRLFVITGRELPDLKRIFPHLDLCDRVVAENGALMFDPATGRERLLSAPPSMALVSRLRELRVEPLSVGRGIVATWEPNQSKVLGAIKRVGLELQIIFNKGAIMILPPGVNKASGLRVALSEFGLSPHNVVGVGDAENDHAFLRTCGCSAAVQNAIEAIKAEADIVLGRDHGRGVAELIDRLISDDVSLAPAARHAISIGLDRAGKDVVLHPGEGGVLITGPSRSGKSTLIVALTERMAEKRFDFCVIDPEGDYVQLKNAVCLGNADRPPTIGEAVEILEDSAANLVLWTEGMPMKAREAFLSVLMERIADTHGRTGRPHWLLVDEAHQVLASAHRGAGPSRHELPAVILSTVSPQCLALDVVDGIGTVLALGPQAGEYLCSFARRAGLPEPDGVPVVAAGELLHWRPRGAQPPQLVHITPPCQAHRRHRGKYATGDVGSHRSFYFRGPQRQFDVPAKNLFSFIEIAAEMPDEVWNHHLRAGDFSAWFEHVIRDRKLAEVAETIRSDETLDAESTRRLINQAILRDYAAPIDLCGDGLPACNESERDVANSMA